MSRGVVKVGRGKSEVTITGALAGELERELRTALGAVADEIDAEGKALLKSVQERFPRKTGKSAESFDYALRVQPGEMLVEGIVYSPLKHIPLIRSTKVGDQDDAVRIRSPLVTEIWVPAREAKKRLKKVLPAILGRALGGR